jgi:hypothetical protein
MTCQVSHRFWPVQVIEEVITKSGHEPSYETYATLLMSVVVC